MVPFLLLTGVGLLALSGWLVARSILLPRMHLKTHLGAVLAYGFDPAQAPTGQAAGGRKGPLGGVATRLGALIRQRVPFLQPLTRSDLSAAGRYGTSVDMVHGYRAMAAAGSALLGLLYLAAAGAGMSPTVLIVPLVLAGAGWHLPGFFIRRRGAARLDDMDRHLPELIDLLIATVEAGMGLGAAINLVADRFSGPLGDELRLAVQQQTLGISAGQAFTDMADRCNTASMRSFVRTITSGESMGVSIGPILRELTVDMRRRRRLTAKEKIQKAPVKMIFPLMFLIFPALIIELMFPAAYSILSNLSGV
jgi:tight adherence protein C